MQIKSINIIEKESDYSDKTRRRYFKFKLVMNNCNITFFKYTNKAK